MADIEHKITEPTSYRTPDRFIRIALTALTRTPKLTTCDHGSFFQALLDLSQLGLEPDGRRAHLIPFRNNKRNCVECQLIIDYKGLALRVSGATGVGLAGSNMGAKVVSGWAGTVTEALHCLQRPTVPAYSSGMLSWVPQFGQVQAMGIGLVLSACDGKAGTGSVSLVPRFACASPRFAWHR